MKFGNRRSSETNTKTKSDRYVVVYFASDLHASALCWRKFLAAPKFYGADVIIIGGDLSGKFLVPIVRQEDGSWKARYHGTDRILTSRDEVDKLIAMTENSGSYAVEMSLEEFQQHQLDPSKSNDLFDDQIRRRLEEWVKLADERLSGQGIKCYVSGGNDDAFELDQILKDSETITVPDRQIVNIDDDIEMLSLGYANQTPWNCPRDISEEELGEKIAELTAKVRNIDHCIFNIHVPPFDSGLDMAPELDENLAAVRSPSGEVNFVPVGSKAVRAAIEKSQPLLGLHGHIHEGQGILQLGRTVVANPGSEYQEGLLRGVLVKVDKESWTMTPQLVMG